MNCSQGRLAEFFLIHLQLGLFRGSIRRLFFLHSGCEGSVMAVGNRVRLLALLLGWALLPVTGWAQTNSAAPAELLQKLQQASPENGAKLLDDAIAADPANFRLHSYRSLVASRYVAAGKLPEALKQAEQGCDAMMQHLDDPTAARMTVSSVQMYYSYARRAGNPDTSRAETALAGLRKVAEQSRDARYLQPIAQLTVLRGELLAGSGRSQDAVAAIREELQSLRAAIEQASTSEDAVLAAAKLLQGLQMPALGQSEAEQGAVKQQLQELFADALKRLPESSAVMSEYLRLQGSEASRLSGTDPEAATRILESARALAAESALKEQPAVKAAVAMYAPLDRRIESARLQLQMIGKPAPPLDIAATAHGAAVTAESLKGKVVLLDFWAIWCGPCIATFPHLNSIYDEFHSRGLEIVGVTRQYGYQWNAETKRAARAEGDVSMEAELGMLEEFMKHHELRHSTIVTPKESAMQKQFGVTGIPHAVLIDRQGNVRMIKVGSGEANAKALHDMVQKLLAE